MSLMNDWMRSFTESQDGGMGWKRKPVEPKPPKGTPAVRLLISLVITLLFGGIYFYIQLPALNIHNEGLYWFLFWMCIVFCICMILLGGFRSGTPTEYLKYMKKRLFIPFWLIIIIIAVVAIGTVSGLEVFRAKAYSELLTTENGDFASEVDEVSWNEIPILDEASANTLANRKLGEVSDLVSQFTVSEESAQINYQGGPVRVTYLDYGNIFKWWNNRNEGIPAYMFIDMTTMDVEVVRLEEGIKYSPSEYFNRDLMRHLRFSYPTLMFDDVNFEVDEEGTPYWVASVITKKIGLFGGTDVTGAVTLNAITGESQYYPVEEVPKWVDRVYSADLLLAQYNYYGKYLNGFWNSMFGQSECTMTTEGSNFIAQDDDIWVYTGVTSVTGDRGNIGFILVNQRTKEAKYYPGAGAEEYSAMSSAQGAVQQYNYQATFPLLLNISDEPTYFMSLKDNAGLVKMYAMVNVQQYQIVATGNTVNECQKRYYELLQDNGIIEEVPDGMGEADKPEEPKPETPAETVTGVIEEIRTANIDGNTIFYLKLSGNTAYYTVSAKDYPMAPILNVGDTVELSHEASEEELIPAEVISRTEGKTEETETPKETETAGEET